MAKHRNVYKGGAKAKKFDDLFTPDLLPGWINPTLVRATNVEDKTLRAEYSRLRAIANKRLARMEGKPEAQSTFEAHPEPFPTVRGMDRAEVVKQLSIVTHFLAADRGSLSGIHKTNKKIRESLAKKGINVPKDQLDKFGSFMNAMKKALGVNRGDYASEQIANLWQELFNEGKISRADFERRVKDLMRDIQANNEVDPKKARKQRKEVNKLLRDSPIDNFFDELALDPRTVRAKAKRDTRAQENARQARRKATVKRRKRRYE